MSAKKPLKIVMIGNASVGKTSILQSYMDKKFTGRYKATIGADISSIETSVEGKPVVLQIWDTAGQQKFRSLGNVFYKGTDCCVIVYDITDLQSFKAVQEWRDAFIQGCAPKQPEKFPFVVIANKIDLQQQRKVPIESSDQFIRIHKNTVHLNVSAKQQNGLDTLIQTIAKKANDNRPVQIFIPTVIKPLKPKRQNSKTCCN